MHNTPTVSLALRSYSGQVELHDHHFHQLVLPQSGAMQIELDGRAGQVDWRQGVVIPAGARHAFMAQSNNSFLVLDVPLAQTVAGPLSEQRFFAVAPDIRHLLDYASRSAPLMLASPALAASWSTLLLASLTHTPAKPPSPDAQLLARVQEFMARHLARDLTARCIAHACGTSERKLYLLLREHLGCTPFTYLTRLRLDRAADLLRDTRVSISDIAQQVGYADQSALTHALKKNRQLTPGALRRG